MFYKVCTPHRYSCSDKSVFITIGKASSSTCNNKLANVTINLPGNHGFPKAYFCREPCNDEYKQVSDDQMKQIGLNTFSFIAPQKWPPSLYVRGSTCRNQICHLGYNNSLWNNCGEFSPSTKYNNSSSNQVAFFVGMAILGSFLLILLITGIFIYFRKRKIWQKQSIVYSYFQIPVDVFLVYLNDHPNHTEVVLKFAALLKQDYGVNVRLDLYEREKIYSNPAGWLDEVMTSCKKVLVIWSPGAEAKWRNQEQITDRHEMFTPVLRRLNHDLIMSSNLEKYQYAYFDYCSETDIPPSFRNRNIAKFQLTKQRNNLIMKLADETRVSSYHAKNELQKSQKKMCKNENEILEIALNKMRVFAKQNPKWYELTESSQIVVEKSFSLQIDDKNIYSEIENDEISSVWTFIKNEPTATVGEKIC